MKQYYFISGLPRSGSTLLSTILRQNPDFYTDITSPIELIVENSINIISGVEINLTLNEHRRKKLICGIFDGYYGELSESIIFDTSRFWTRKTSMIKEMFPYTKILCTVRDIVSILNSFEIISSKNSFYTNTLVNNNHNVFSRCDEMMDTTCGLVGIPWVFLREGYAMNPEMIYFVEYENLCKEPEKTMRGVYEFLEKPYYSHDFDNLEYSNENFDKACNLKGLHTVKKKIEYNPPRCILPPEIVKKYSEMNMEFWKKDYKSCTNNNEMLNKKNIKYK